MHVIKEKEKVVDTNTNRGRGKKHKNSKRRFLRSNKGKTEAITMK
jgi:hypothetical protein